MNGTFWPAFLRNVLYFATGFFAVMLLLHVVAWLFGQVVASLVSFSIFCLSVIAIITLIQLRMIWRG